MTDVSATPMPMGYVDCSVAREAVASAFAAAGVDISARSVQGECHRQLAAGVSYLNLHDAEADFVRGQGSSLVKSRRNVMDCGVLQPFSQRTGICNGCSHSAAGWLSWCYRYVNSGDCQSPREVTFLGGYLLGREMSLLSRGDSGAFPNYTAKGYHEIGCLPIDAGGKYSFRDMTPEQQEDVCVAMRDRPSLSPEWVDAMAPLKTRVFNPTSAMLVADCLFSGYPVTFGTSIQGREAPNPGGISSVYGMSGGHETCGSGIAALRGRLILLKTESWWNANHFPGGAFPGNRITIQTDAGPKLLYPGQGAVWLDEWMQRGNPECWAYAWPGSAA